MPTMTLAKFSELDRLLKLLAKQEATVRRDFMAFVSTVTSPEILKKVRLLLAKGDIRGALDMADEYVVRLSGFIPRVFSNVASAEIDRLGRQAGIAIDFDPGNERAADLMESSRLEFVTNFTRTQRKVTRDALTAALRSGAGAQEAADAFRDSIGLNEAQAAAVDNYRRLLEAGSSEALDRAVRDRRFDSTVAGAIRSGDPLKPSQIDRMVDRYQSRMLDLRAETIARTETHRVANQARQESFEQSLEQTGFNEDDVIRRWAAVKDKRTRDTHYAMDGQEVGLHEPFISPSGAELMFPGDPKAPADETINCLLPGSMVDSPDLLATLRGQYDGEAVTFVTAGDRRLSVTANHPVLTGCGWKPAKFLDQGDQLVCYAGVDRVVASPSTDANYVPAFIENIHDSGSLFLHPKIMAGVNLHGDRLKGQVEIVLQARSLLFTNEPPLTEPVTKHRLIYTGVGQPMLSGYGAIDLCLKGVFLTAPRMVGRQYLRLPLFLGALQVLDNFGLTASPWFSTVDAQGATNGSSGNLELFGELIDRCPGIVLLDQVVRVSRYPFSGHVYSPQTRSGVYLAGNGLVNHNCRCVVLVDFKS